MNIDDIKLSILNEFGFTPTNDQENALQVFSDFLLDRSNHAVMILRGSAGTGKTCLAGAIVRTMKSIGQRIVLLAPTGRAAKVLSLNSGSAANTIHRRIYREREYTGIGGTFNLNDNLHRDTLFIVDEASMINNSLSENPSGGFSAFGSGRLLYDLISFVYSGTNDRMLLIGDKAQLPPIGEDESPALNGDMLSSFGLHVYECDLDEVLRQGNSSGILYNATVVRNMITHDDVTQLPKIRFHCFADIISVRGDELIESLASSYSDVGMDETIVITRSNKRANIYNQGIRNTVLDREDRLCRGDMVMIVKNNYHYSISSSDSLSSQTTDATSDNPMSVVRKSTSGLSRFIANGDRAEVERVRNIRSLYGFSFADVLLQFPDYDNYELEATVILDTLTSNSPSLTMEQQEELYKNVMEDYQDVALKQDRMKELRQNDCFNALQIKFAYAVTCHKAQGGQWPHVYVDQGYMTDDMLSPDYIHWLYTAFTRATDKLFLVNWPSSQTEDGEDEN
nr:AAA family ATPase [Prevotella sp.]